MNCKNQMSEWCAKRISAECMRISCSSLAHVNSAVAKKKLWFSERERHFEINDGRLYKKALTDLVQSLKKSEKGQFQGKKIIETSEC